MAVRHLPAGVWLAALALTIGGSLGAVWYATSAGSSTGDEPAKREAPAPEKPAGKHGDLKMDKKQQEYLWQLEHHGNLLNRYGYKPLAKALVAQDATALRRLLAADFRGGLLDKPREVVRQTELIQFSRRIADRSPRLVSADGFLTQLLDYRRPFLKGVQAQLSVMRLTPTDPNDFEKPWDASARLRLWGEKAPGKPREVMLYIKLRVARPGETFDRGGWLQRCEITQEQIASSEHFLMREVAVERGLHPEKLHDNWKKNIGLGGSGGAYLCDFNRDGILDVLIVDTNGYFLYQGLPGGKFRDVTAEMGLPSTTAAGKNVGRDLAAAFVDLDGDGWEDLILGAHVYRNLQGKRFEDVNFTTRCNLVLPPNTLGIAVADYDRDGKMDLYIFEKGQGKADSWLEGKSGPEHPGNKLFRNKGNWQFEDVTAKSGTDGGGRSTFTAVWLDANNDGWPDLFVPNEFGNGVLYVNQRDGTFRPHALGNGPTDFGTMGVTAGDLDNDGNIDIYCCNMYSKAGARVIGNTRPDTYPKDVMAQIRTFVKGSEMHRNLGGLRFEQLGQALQVHDAGWAYGAALVDLDNDGWLDLHATAGYISRDRNEPDG